MPQKIVPIVSFEVPEGIMQEELPEIYPDELLSLGYESSLLNLSSSTQSDMEMLILTVYTLDENSFSLLSGTPTASVVIHELSTDTEVTRKEMVPAAASAMSKKGLNTVTFQADLSEYQEREGSFTVWIELMTESGIFYREQVASFNYEEKEKHTFAQTGGTGILYPIW